MSNKTIKRVKNSVQTQVEANVVASKLDAMTKELNQLKLHANNVSRNVQFMAQTSGDPIVRKRKTNKKNKKPKSTVEKVVNVVKNVTGTITVILIFNLITGAVGAAVEPNVTTGKVKVADKFANVEPGWTDVYVEQSLNAIGHKDYIAEFKNFDSSMKYNNWLSNKLKDKDYKKSYHKCVEHFLEIKKITNKFYNKYDEEFIKNLALIDDGMDFCKHYHRCYNQCRAMGGSDCLKGGIDECQNNLLLLKDSIKMKIINSIDNDDFTYASMKFGCVAYPNWRQLGWLRGAKDMEEVSCVEGTVDVIHRECKKVHWNETGAYTVASGSTVLSSVVYVGPQEYKTASTSFAVSPQNRMEKTLRCFTDSELYHHLTNQPACSSCMKPFEILWENGCFRGLKYGKALQKMRIYEDITTFKFDGEEERTCDNLYGFAECCAGSGPSPKYEDENHMDKYCHCSLKQRRFSGTIYRFVRTAGEQVIMPQFAFHITMFFILALVKRSLAIVYLALILFWVVPTSEAVCGIEQLVPSDLSAKMGSDNLQEINMRVGQCVQISGHSYELVKIQAMIPYAFRKHVPYHLKVVCSHFDWGCRYGTDTDIYHSVSDCYHDCLGGLHYSNTEMVGSFSGDGCLIGNNVATRLDACFSPGSTDSFATIFEKLSSEPRLLISFVSHAAKEQKEFVYDTADKTQGKYLKIHSIKVQDTIMPKMFAVRMGHGYCSNTYVETGSICGSRLFGDVTNFTVECMRIRQKWLSDESKYGIQFEKNDFETGMLDRFSVCENKFDRKMTGDTLQLIDNVKWLKMVVSGKEFAYAKSAEECDLKNVKVSAKPGISGYHSSTTVTVFNGGNKCRMNMKLVGCTSTEGTLLIMNSKETVDVAFWCSYNATGLVKLKTSNDERSIGVQVVKNFVPHKNTYQNFWVSTYEKVSHVNLRNVLRKFWQKLDWPKFVDEIFDWCDRKAFKLFLSILLFVLCFMSFSKGNLLLMAFFGALSYLVCFTGYVVADALKEVEFVERAWLGYLFFPIFICLFKGVLPNATLSLARVLAVIKNKLHADLLNLVSSWNDFGPNNAVKLFDLLQFLLCFSLYPVIPEFLYFIVFFNFVNQFIVYSSFRSSVYNGCIGFHYPLTTWLYARMLYFLPSAEDYLDDFNARQPCSIRVIAERLRHEMVYCSDGQITEAEAKFATNVKGWSYRNIFDVCYVVTYLDDGGNQTWWIPKHCLKEHDKQSDGYVIFGLRRKAGDIKDAPEFANVKDFRCEEGYSGFPVLNRDGLWIFISHDDSGTHWAHLYQFENVQVQCGQDSWVKVRRTKEGIEGEDSQHMKITIPIDFSNDIVEFVGKDYQEINDEYEKNAVVSFVPMDAGANMLASVIPLATRTGEKTEDSFRVSPGGEVFRNRHKFRLPLAKRVFTNNRVLICENFAGLRAPVWAETAHLNVYRKAGELEKSLDLCIGHSLRHNPRPKCFGFVLDIQKNPFFWSFKRVNVCTVVDEKRACFFTAARISGLYPSNSVLSFSGETAEGLYGVCSFAKDGFSYFVGNFGNYSSFAGMRYIDQSKLNKNGIGTPKYYTFMLGSYLETDDSFSVVKKIDLCREIVKLNGDETYQSAGWNLRAELALGKFNEYLSNGDDPSTIEEDEEYMTLMEGLMIEIDDEYCKPMVVLYPPTLHADCSESDRHLSEFDGSLPTKDTVESLVYDCTEIGMYGPRFWIETGAELKKLESLFKVRKERFHLVWIFMAGDVNDVEKIRGFNVFRTEKVEGLVPDKYLRAIDGRKSRYWNFFGVNGANEVQLKKYEMVFNNFCTPGDYFARRMHVGLLGNAANTGSYFINSDGVLVTQYHVTYGNRVHMYTTSTGDIDFGVAKMQLKGGDLCVYGGDFNFTPMVPGEIVIAFNPHFKVGIYLQFAYTKRLLQRGGALVNVLKPVSRVDGQWIRKEDWGFPGMSGSPIVNQAGQVVGVYGLQQRVINDTVSGVQSCSPMISSGIVSSEFFQRCAENFVKESLKPGKKFFVMNCPTGTGKSTTLPYKIAGVLRRGSLLLVQPNRSACTGAYQRILELMNMTKDSERFRLRLELKMGTSTSDENCCAGDVDADCSITLVTYGWLALDVSRMNDYTHVLLDECHKLDDVDVCSTIIYSETMLDSGIKVLRSSATPIKTGDSQDVAAGDTIGGTNFTISEENMINSDSNDKNKDGYMYIPHKKVKNATGGDVKIKLDSIVGKTVLFFCASKRDCDAGVILGGEYNKGNKCMPFYSGISFNFLQLEAGTWVFATNIAQQSITIPNLDVVVDFGVEIKPRISLTKGIQGINYRAETCIGVIDLSSAIQRKGRIGRTREGTYIKTNVQLTRLDSFREDYIPHILLKCSLMRIDYEKMISFSEGKYSDLFDEVKWLMPERILDDRNYSTYIRECVKRKASMSTSPMSKLKICVRAEGDWLLLYLRAHCADEYNGDPRKFPKHVIERTREASKEWWQKYSMYVVVLNEPDQKLDSMFKGRSYLESITGNSGKDDLYPDAEAYFEAIGGDCEFDENSALTALAFVGGGMAFSAAMAGIIGSAVLIKCDRKILTQFSIAESNVATTALYCANRYQSEREHIDSKLSYFARLRMWFSKLWHKVKSFVEEMFAQTDQFGVGKKGPKVFKEDSFESFWITVTNKVMVGLTAAAKFVGLEMVPMLAGSIGSVALGSIISRMNQTVGKHLTLVLLLGLESVIGIFAGMNATLMVGVGMCFGALLKQIAFPKVTNYLRIERDFWSIFSPILATMGGCVAYYYSGMLTVVPNTAASVFTNRFGSILPIFTSNYGTGGAAFLFYKHLYMFLCEAGEPDTNWFSNVCSHLSSGLIAFSNSNFLGLGIGLVCVCVMFVVRMMYESVVREKVSSAKNAAAYDQNYVGNRMKQFDTYVSMALNAVSCAIDPISVLSIVVEYAFRRFVGNDNMVSIRGAFNRAGVPLVSELLDVMVRMVSVAMTADGFRENSDGSVNFVGIFKSIWLSLTNWFGKVIRRIGGIDFRQNDVPTWVGIFVRSIARMFDSIVELFSKFWRWLRGRTSENMTEVANRITDGVLTRVAERLPITGRFMDLFLVSDEKCAAVKNPDIEKLIVDTWIAMDYCMPPNVHYFTDMNYGGLESYTAGRISTETIKVKANALFSHRLNVPISCFRLTVNDVKKLLASVGIESSMYGGGVLKVQNPFAFSVETTFTKDVVKYCFTMNRQTAVAVLKGDSRSTEWHLVSEMGFGMMKYLESLLKKIFKDESRVVSVERTPQIVEMYRQQGVILVEKSVVGSVVGAAKLLTGGVLGFLKNSDSLTEMQYSELPTDVLDWAAYNVNLIKASCVSRRPLNTTAYACPSLNYPHLDNDELMCLGQEAIDDLLSKSIDLGGSDEVLWSKKLVVVLTPNVKDRMRNCKSCCFAQGTSLVVVSDVGGFLWSRVGNDGSVLIVSENGLKFVQSKKNPSTFGKISDESERESLLWDGIKHIHMSAVNGFFEKMGLERNGEPIKAEISVGEELLKHEDFIRNSSGNSNSIFARLTAEFDDVWAKLLAEKCLETVASVPVVKKFALNVEAGVREESEEMEEFLDAEDFAWLVGDHTTYARWTAGFDQPLKGRLNTWTWFPEDQGRMRKQFVRYSDTIDKYSELNRIGGRMVGTTWERIKSLERYVLPKRVEFDKGYHSVASRGFFKMQQLVEMSDFFDNCNTILSPTSGYGGFEQCLGLHYSRHKPKTIFSCSLYEIGHRIPNLVKMSVADSNVRVVNLAEGGLPGKGNIKDRDYIQFLKNKLLDVDLDCLIMDVGEYRDESVKQYEYWMKPGVGITSLLDGFVELISLMPKGSKMMFKFTGIFANCNVILYEILKHYKKVRVVKIGTTSLFSPEYYIFCAGKTEPGKGLNCEQVCDFCDTIADCLNDNLSRARQLLGSNVNHRLKPLYRSDWYSVPNSGIVYRNLNSVDNYPKGFTVDVPISPYGKIYDTFEPRYTERIANFHAYLSRYCGQRRRFITAGRLGMKEVCEIGFYPLKKTVVNEKHTKNYFISEFLKKAHGLNDDNSTYGQTQATQQWREASVKKRLDVNPGNLDPGVFKDLMEITSLMRTEYGKNMTGLCRLLEPEEVEIALNKGGATAMFSKHPNMRHFLEANSRMENGRPLWYNLAMELVVNRWFKGETSHSFMNVMHKNEPKQKKNVKNGTIDASTKDNLSEYNNLMHRFIQYNDEITRIAHYIVFGDLMKKSSIQKIYKGTINGIPPHLAGRVLRAMWDLNNVPSERHVNVGENNFVDLDLRMNGGFCFEPERGGDFTGPAAGLLDFSQWDTTVTKQERFLEYLFIRQFYPEYMWKMLKSCCEEMCYAICMDRDGNVWLRDGQRGSGEVFLTSFGNTLLVDANVYRAVAYSNGLTFEQTLETVGHLDVRLSGGIIKRYELTRIPQVADGDDVVVFGSVREIERLSYCIDEKLNEAGKSIRSGTDSGMKIVTNFGEVFFCSYNYELTLVGPDARSASLDERRRVEVARKNSAYKLYYLPTRNYTDILGRIRLTLKEAGQRDDLLDDRIDGTLNITRSKIISYLLMHPHLRNVRNLCLPALACLGDGRMTDYDLKAKWSGSVSPDHTAMSAMKSLFGITTLDDMSCVQYEKEIHQLKKLRHNLSLTGRQSSIRMKDVLTQYLRTMWSMGIRDRGVLKWDSVIHKQFENMIIFERFDDVVVERVVFNELKTVMESEYFSTVSRLRKRQWQDD